MQAQTDLAVAEWLLAQDNCSNCHHQNSYGHCSTCLTVSELYDEATMDLPSSRLDFVQEHLYRLVYCFAIYEPHYETISVCGNYKVFNFSFILPE